MDIKTINNIIQTLDKERTNAYINISTYTSQEDKKEKIIIFNTIVDLEEKILNIIKQTLK